jgi:4-hydroxy-4-methyl-2-oxoglutarate aldolase
MDAGHISDHRGDTIMTTSTMSASHISRIFERVGCAQLYDACGGRARPIGAGLRLRTPGLRMAGPVVPVGTDNDMLPALQALHFASAGSVLYVQNQGSGNDALAGDIFMTACRQQGIAGVVIEGAIRDIDQLAGIGVPVFSSAVTFVSAKTAVSPARKVPETLVVDGRELVPGSWLFGDSDGLLVIPAQYATAVATAASLLHEREEQLRRALTEGTVPLGELVGLEGYLSGKGDLSFEF